MNFVHCLYIVLVIRKYTDVFMRDFSGGGSGGRVGLPGRIFPWRNFSWGKIISMKGWGLYIPTLFKKDQKLN